MDRVLEEGLRMAERMTKHGITVVHNKDGSWRVSGVLDGKRWSEKYRSFNGAGECAFEMANNNDEGREINHAMCDFFGRSFF